MSNPRKNHNLLASKFYLYQTPNAREDLLEEISHPVPTALLRHQSTNSQKRKYLSILAFVYEDIKHRKRTIHSKFSSVPCEIQILLSLFG